MLMVGRGAAQLLVADEELRGVGVATVKSERLLPVSAQPLLFLSAAVELESTGVGAVSEQFADPKPTKSAMLAPVGQVPESEAWSLTSANFPLLEEAVMTVLSRSGVGRTAPLGPSGEILTRK